MFTNLFSELLKGYIIKEEKSNFYSYSSGWKNLITLHCIDKDGKHARIDFRLAFRDVTEENLIDFIDYDNLLNKQYKYFEEYIIVYLGIFINEIPAHEVGEQFVIDSRCKRINHIYYSLDKDLSLIEIIKNDFPNDFILLEPIIPNDKSSVSGNKEKNFGSRITGWGKVNLPDRPLISIIIPSFNSEAIIEQALQSAIAQTYNNKEIIIIDGGSTDATALIVKKYKNKIDWFNSEPDKNIFDAINKGTFLSKGMYSIFIGSDDLLFPDALENFVSEFNRNGQKDFFYGNYLNLHPSGRLNIIKTFIESKYYGKFQIGHPAMFINKNTFEEFNGFNDKYYICADADFELKLITEKKTGCKLDNDISIFRGGGHSSFKMHNVKQVYQIFKKYDALNLRYYSFAFKMQILNIFIIVFGKKNLDRLISILKRSAF